MNHMLDPAILFFVFGVLAGTVKSNLEIPPAISRFLSLYLLMALGLKGGFALAHSGLTPEVGKSLAAAIALADEPIAAIYTSDLSRAHDTARAIGQAHGLTPQPEPGLRERAFGVFEKRTWAEIESLWPEEAICRGKSIGTFRLRPTWLLRRSRSPECSTTAIRGR